MTDLKNRLDLHESNQYSLTEEYYKDVSKVPEKLGIPQKDLGAFYTDKDVVTYVLKHLEIRKGDVILDPACGCGSFLFPLYEMANQNNIPNVEDIYGIDIDERAVTFTRDAIKSIVGSKSDTITTKKILLGDFVFDNFSLEQQKQKNLPLLDIKKKGGFQYIIGNPPYNIKNITKKKVTLADPVHRKIAESSKNMPIYFILRGIEFLQESGVLVFVLPKSLLFVRKYEGFRKYLLRNFKLIRIAEIGMKFKDVRGEQIIMFVKKEKPSPESRIEFVSLPKSSLQKDNSSFSVLQSYFFDKISIPIFADKEIFGVLDLVDRNSVKLSNFVQIGVFRGLPIRIKETTGNTQIGNYEAQTLCVRGKDIGKGQLRRLCSFDNQIKEITKLEKLKKPKIIMQNIYSSESGVISFLDKIGLITSETVTNLWISDLNKLSFVYGLLNSKLINFYIFYSIFSQSKLTMHLDSHYIAQIPIIWKEENNLVKAIIELSDEIRDIESTELKHLLSKLDTLVYELYGLTDDMIIIIEKAMSNVLSKRSMW